MMSILEFKQPESPQEEIDFYLNLIATFAMICLLLVIGLISFFVDIYGAITATGHSVRLMPVIRWSIVDLIAIAIVIYLIIRWVHRVMAIDRKVNSQTSPP
jgi:hypothetical protein